MKKLKNKFPEVMAIVGSNRCGKHTTIEQMIKKWKKENKKGKVICFDPLHRFRELTDFIITEENQNWAEELMRKENGKYKYKNSLLVLSNYRMLFYKHSTPPVFLKLLGKLREINIKIIYSSHRPENLLERITYYTSHYLIFLSDKDSKWRSLTPNYINLKKASDMVRLFVGKRDRRNYYPNFPHITVHASSGRFDYNNMNNLNYK